MKDLFVFCTTSHFIILMLTAMEIINIGRNNRISDDRGLVKCISFEPASMCPANSNLEECEEYMNPDELFCEADKVLPDGNPSFEINNCDTFDVFRCVFVTESPESFELYSRIGNWGHFAGNGKYTISDSAVDTYENKNGCKMAKMKNVDNCATSTCNNSCLNQLCYEASCPNHAFDHVFPPTIFMNCTFEGPQTCKKAEYVLYEGHPETGNTIASTDKFQFDDVKIKNDIKPNLSQLHPFSFTSMKPIAQKDYRDLHLKIWVSLLIVVVLILVVDVCGPNYVYRGLKQTREKLCQVCVEGRQYFQRQVENQNKRNDSLRSSARYEVITSSPPSSPVGHQEFFPHFPNTENIGPSKDERILDSRPESSTVKHLNVNIDHTGLRRRSKEIQVVRETPNQRVRTPLVRQKSHSLPCEGKQNLVEDIVNMKNVQG